ncbi:unnamed protein product [Caretta caretta]
MSFLLPQVPVSLVLDLLVHPVQKINHKFIMERLPLEMVHEGTHLLLATIDSQGDFWGQQDTIPAGLVIVHSS